MTTTDPSAGTDAATASLSQATIVLPERLDASGLSALQSQISTHRLNNENLVLNAASVERVSTVGIQFIVAADKSMTDAGLALTIAGMPDEMRTAICDLGLSDKLEKWGQENES